MVNVSATATVPAHSVIETIDPVLSTKSLPLYPALPGTMDQAKVEELRRTVYVSNLDPRVSFENLNDLFTQVGEIKYVRMTKSEQGLEYENLGMTNSLVVPDDVDILKDSVAAYVEFSEQPSIIKALCLNGLQFGGRPLKVIIFITRFATNLKYKYKLKSR